MDTLADRSEKTLCFPPEALNVAEFDAQLFVSRLRAQAPLRVLRDDLRVHIALLQHQIVTILQNDFGTFSSLNAAISDADSLASNIQAPLENLQSALSGVINELKTQIETLDITLARRRSIKETRTGLHILIQSNDLLHKCERLLREYGSLPANSSERLSLVERIAGETAQLSFVLSRVAENEFVKSLAFRISAVRRGVRTCLDTWLRRVLLSSPRNEFPAESLSRVLSMYVVAGLSADAENFFRKEVVVPFTNSRLRMTAMLVAAERKKPHDVTAADAMIAAEEEIVEFLGDKVTPLVSLCESEERLRSKLDFIGRSVWPQIEQAISSNMTAAFSPGIPDVFHRSVLAGYRIFAAVEASVGHQRHRDILRTSSATSNFWRHWNLPVYFQLRFQEITSKFDSDLTKGPVSSAEISSQTGDWNNSDSRLLRTDLYRATPTASLVACLRRCWAEDVFLPSLTHRFLRLSLQLLARYSTWVRTGLAGEWDDQVAISTGAARVFYDIGLLKTRVPAEISSVLRLRASSMDADMLEHLDTAFADAVEGLSVLLPDLSRSIADALARKCVDNLQPLRGILATYRMSSKQAPSTHSSFVPKILKPLKTFAKDQEDAIERGELIKIERIVAEQTTAEYFSMATDLLQRNKSSEATLRRLNIGRSGALSGLGSNPSSVIDKISTQLFLDVEKYSDEVRALGLPCDDIESLARLRESVTQEINPGNESEDMTAASQGLEKDQDKKYEGDMLKSATRAEASISEGQQNPEDKPNIETSEKPGGSEELKEEDLT